MRRLRQRMEKAASVDPAPGASLHIRVRRAVPGRLSLGDTAQIQASDLYPRLCTGADAGSGLVPAQQSRKRQTRGQKEAQLTCLPGCSTTVLSSRGRTTLELSVPSCTRWPGCMDGGVGVVPQQSRPHRGPIGVAPQVIDHLQQLLKTFARVFAFLRARTQ